MDESLISRFECGFVAEIALPEFELRVALIRRKAQNRGHAPLEEVVNYLATHTSSSNIREIEGVVNSLVARASLGDVPADLTLARQILPT